MAGCQCRMVEVGDMSPIVLAGFLPMTFCLVPQMMTQICTLLDTPFLKTVSDVEFPGCGGGRGRGAWGKTSLCFEFSSVVKVFCPHLSSAAKSPLSVPRSKSEMSYIDGEKVVKRSATLPLPARSSSLKSSPERWVLPRPQSALVFRLSYTVHHLNTVSLSAGAGSVGATSQADLVLNLCTVTY